MYSVISTKFIRFLKPAPVLNLLAGAVLFTAAVVAVTGSERTDFSALMTKGKLEADLGKYESAASTFSSVANAETAPTVLRSEALVRYGLVCSLAGNTAESMEAFKTVREKYSGEPETADMLIGALASGLPGKIWVDFKTEFEELLKTAEIASSDDIGPGGGPPKVAYLRWNDVEVKTVWRPSIGEIAAYELDKIFGLDMVPPTVEREFEDHPGSLQLWVHDCRTLKDMSDQVPKDMALKLDLSRLKLFDYLIANEDRNWENILIDPAGSIVGVDHSDTFSDADHPVDRLEKFDRQLIKRLRNLSKVSLQVRLEGILDTKGINSILHRRARLVAHVDRLIAERGESEVLF